VHPDVARKGPARYVWASSVRADTPGHFFNAVLQLDLQTAARRLALGALRKIRAG
jgi:hypothetical protein